MNQSLKKTIITFILSMTLSSLNLGNLIQNVCPKYLSQAQTGRYTSTNFQIKKYQPVFISILLLTLSFCKTLFKQTVLPVPGAPDTYRLPFVHPFKLLSMKSEIIDVSLSLQSILSGTDVCSCCRIKAYCLPVNESEEMLNSYILSQGLCYPNGSKNKTGSVHPLVVK